MRVLITGGAGFIGSHLAEAYLARGDEVFVLDDLSTGSIDNIRHLKGHDRFHYAIESVHHGPTVSASLAGDGPVPADAVVLRGPAVALVEALSLRASFPAPVPDADRWALGTLDVVFDQT